MIKTHVLNLLKTDRQYTPKQLAGLIGTSEESIRARISELRQEGYAIFSNSTKNGKLAYRLETPSKEMVMAAYKHMGSEVFSRV